MVGVGLGMEVAVSVAVGVGLGMEIAVSVAVGVAVGRPQASTAKSKTRIVGIRCFMWDSL
jgi:hypothetical protein